MTRYRQLVLILLALELLAAVAIRTSAFNRPAALPVSELGIQEDGLLADMRQLEASHDPASPHSWLTMADFYSTFGLLPQAEYCLQQATLLGPLDEDGLMFQGIVLSRMGQLVQAQLSFQAVVDAAGERQQDARVELALVLLRQEDVAAAETALRAAQAEPLIKLALARLLIRTDRAEEAIQLLDQMLERQPGAMCVIQLKGWAYEALGNDRLARQQAELAQRHIQLTEMRTSTRLHERAMHQRYGPGRYLVESGRHEQAGDVAATVASMQAAVEAMKPLWRYHYAMRLAVLQLNQQQAQLALPYLAAVIQVEGESAEMWDLIGDAWQQLEDPQRARKAWLEGTRYKASKSIVVNQLLHQELAESYQLAGDKEQADRHAGLAFFERGRLAWRENDVRQALTSYTEAVGLLPENASCWFHLAETRRAMNDRNGARDAYQQCLELAAEHGRAHLGLSLTAGSSN